MTMSSLRRRIDTRIYNLYEQGIIGNLTLAQSTAVVNAVFEELNRDDGVQLTFGWYDDDEVLND